MPCKHVQQVRPGLDTSEYTFQLCLPHWGSCLCNVHGPSSSGSISIDCKSFFCFIFTLCYRAQIRVLISPSGVIQTVQSGKKLVNMNAEALFDKDLCLHSIDLIYKDRALLISHLEIPLWSCRTGLDTGGCGVVEGWSWTDCNDSRENQKSVRWFKYSSVVHSLDNWKACSHSLTDTVLVRPIMIFKSLKIQ